MAHIKKKKKEKDEDIDLEPKHPPTPHECAITRCHQIIYHKPHKKYCSANCRQIAIMDSRVAVRHTQYKSKFADIDPWLDKFEGVKFKQVPTGRAIVPARKGKGKPKKEKEYQTIAVADIPTLEGYASHLRFTVQTLLAWAKEYPSFQDALDRLVEKKKDLINKFGLTGFYNSKIAALNLMSDHDMKEKSETDNRHSVLAIVKQAYEEADKLERNRLES